MSEFESQEFRFTPTQRSGPVSGLLLRPPGARAVLVLAHGAGAGMRHAFMEQTTDALAGREIATLRYQFPYVEQGRRRPDPRPLLVATARAAMAEAAQRVGDLPLFAGGKSMGGRMTSLGVAEEPFANLRGIVFFGFPLHPAAKPGVERAEHLEKIELPLLFLQGTRDRLAPLESLRPICRRLGSSATLRVIDGADHSFHVLKRSGRTPEDVIVELADQASRWTDSLL